MKNDDVWKCSCGENSFLLQRDGTVFCDACGQVAETVNVTYANPNVISTIKCLINW